MDNAKEVVKTVKAPKPQTAPKQRKGKSLERQKAKMGWLFVAPFLIGFVLIYLPLIFESIKFSFSEMHTQPGSGYITEFIGFENYSKALFEDPDFVKTLVTTLKDLAINIPATVIFALFMAIMLNQKMRGRAVFRAIFFIPVIVSTGIIASIDEGNAIIEAMQNATDMSSGNIEGAASGTEFISAIDISRLFSSIQIGTGTIEWITSLVNDIYDIVNRSGVQMLIFLAGLQSISPAIYESCYMEGASAWETFWKITFPMISPMILVNTIYTIIDSFTSADNAVMQTIQTVYDSSGRMTESVAMSWIYFLIVVLILAVIAGLLSAFVFYQRRD